MKFVSSYVSHQPDKHGYVNYSQDENKVWQTLFRRQSLILPEHACKEYLEGLALLDLSPEEIPQLPDISKKLKTLTGWQVEPVAALISAKEFFNLLANRRFPAATFIRRMEELDYVQEPDIFHEIFGHCPLLTDPIYADFLAEYAKIVLSFPKEDWSLLQRLFWFTVEFGLVKTSEGLRAYGGGILSSYTETIYCIDSDIPLRVLFDPVSALRTPYRIDCLQYIYYVIEDFSTLFHSIIKSVSSSIVRAKELGEFPPFFQVEKDNPSIHIHAC